MAHNSCWKHKTRLSTLKRQIYAQRTSSWIKPLKAIGFARCEKLANMFFQTSNNQSSVQTPLLLYDLVFFSAHHSITYKKYIFRLSRLIPLFTFHSPFCFSPLLLIIFFACNSLTSVLFLSKLKDSTIILSFPFSPSIESNAVRFCFVFFFLPLQFLSLST